VLNDSLRCAFVLNWGVYGLWVGHALGQLTLAICLGVAVLRVDWSKAAKVAQERAQVDKADGVELLSDYE
jgi:hypothetical protein